MQEIDFDISVILLDMSCVDADNFFLPKEYKADTDNFFLPKEYKA